MLGLRFAFMEPHKREWLTDGTLDWLWPAAERAGMPVALPGRVLPADGRPDRRAHPGLKLIVDHFGRPRGSKDEAAFGSRSSWRSAKYPNVAVKATGRAGYSSDAYPFRNIHGHLQAALDAFGPERMFWGTDITRMPCSWRQCVTVFTEELPWLRRDLDLVMGRALCNWVGWNLPGA